MVKTEPTHKKLADSLMESGRSEASALDSVRAEVEKVYSRNRTNELFPAPPRRRGSVGLGYENPVLKGRNLHDKKEWSTEGKPARFLQLFSWNAGNLQRTVAGDTLSDLIASQFHIACIQAEALCGQQLLFESRGIKSLSSADKRSMINSGGTGIKVIRRCYSSDHPHCEMMHRPAYYNDPPSNPKQQCLWFLVADVVAFDNNLVHLERGGQFLWRVASSHLCNVHAKKQEVTQLDQMARHQVCVLNGWDDQAMG